MAEIVSELPSTALVSDVGGGCPCAKADYNIDMPPYKSGTGSRQMDGDVPKTWGDGDSHFTEDAWIVQDIWDRSPWPFPDKSFNLVETP